MTFLEALILGIIQGLTEFLPVSSSGHLELTKELFGLDLEGDQSKLVTIVLHGATALSTVVVYWKDIKGLVVGLFKFKWNWETKYVFMIVISMIPVFLAYIFFKDFIDTFFEGQVILVGCMLLVTAVLLYVTHRFGGGEGEMTKGRSVIVGLSQAIAILPGISRSGSTIASSLLLGISKEKAARFSFLMVLPVIFGGMLIEAKDFVEEGAEQQLDGMALIVGFVTAFLVGVIACRWMVAIVKKSKLSYFALYCAIVGVIAVVAGVSMA